LNPFGGEDNTSLYKPRPQACYLVEKMAESEKALVDAISALMEKMASLEKSVVSYKAELGQVQMKVDLTMQSISLVQQEQVMVAKSLKTLSNGETPSQADTGVMGPRMPPPVAGRQHQPPQPPDSSQRPTQVIHPHPRPNGSDTAHPVVDRNDARNHWLPKMNFPSFDGSDARIWIDKRATYFAMYEIPPSFRVSAASIHMISAGAY
jgi:hypothetical protein